MTILLLLVLSSSCRQDMYDQPRYEPLEQSVFFKDGTSSRPLVEDTVPRGGLQTDSHLFEGRSDGRWAASYPFPITRQVMERGRERYDIFCAVCHDGAGMGNGMIVQRGFPAPSSFHSDRLRQAPPGYYFDVMTNGFGAMFPYADRISAKDRWAIAAYIRALQRSQDATLEDVPPDARSSLKEAAPSSLTEETGKRG